MTELERILVFIADLDRRAAERVEPFPWGTAVINERLRLVYDLNFLRVERGSPDAAELAAECERIQGAAGLGHRLVEVPARDEARLAGRFVGLGWTSEAAVVMVHRRPPDRVRDTASVEDVTGEELLPVREAALRSEERFRDREDVVRQLLDRSRVVADAVPTRYLAARVDGEIASYCDLYARDGVAQIEAVNTVPRFRGRGLASAVVLRALDEGQAGLTFLVADRDDWPQHLYARLGFDEVGGFARFLLREPAG